MNSIKAKKGIAGAIFLFLLSAGVSTALPNTQICEDIGSDADFGMVYKEVVPCNTNANCSEQTIYITKRIVESELYVTAKGSMSSIIAGSSATIAAGCPLAQQGDVLLTGGDRDLKSANYEKIADVDFRAGYEVRLVNGFVAEEGCYFHAYVAPDWDEEHPAWEEDFQSYDSGELDHTNTTHRRFLQRWRFSNGARVGGYRNLPEPNTVFFEDDGGTKVLRIQAFDGATAYPENLDAIHTDTEPFGRYDMLVKWPCVTKGGENDIHHSVWLWATDGANSDEVDNYEKNTGWKHTALHHPDKAPHGMSQNAISWHSNWIRSSGAGQDVDPSVAQMPRFDENYVKISLEWLPNEIRFLVDDCLIRRFGNLHANDSWWRSLGGVNYDFSRNTLRSPAFWLVAFHHDRPFADDMRIAELAVYNLTR